MKKLAFALALLFAGPASAQQPPTPEQYQALVQALQERASVSENTNTQLRAQLILAQRELEALKKKPEAKE